MLTKYGDFDGCVGGAGSVLEYNVVRSSVSALRVFDHQQCLVGRRLQKHSPAMHAL